MGFIPSTGKYGTENFIGGGILGVCGSTVGEGGALRRGVGAGLMFLKMTRRGGGMEVSGLVSGFPRYIQVNAG